MSESACAEQSANFTRHCVIRKSKLRTYHVGHGSGQLDERYLNNTPSVAFVRPVYADGPRAGDCFTKSHGIFDAPGHSMIDRRLN